MDEQLQAICTKIGEKAKQKKVLKATEVYKFVESSGSSFSYSESIFLDLLERTQGEDLDAFSKFGFFVVDANSCLPKHKVIVSYNTLVSIVKKKGEIY